ncbi:hypothetical protein [Shewanella woodyi]|uniref:hypothetical protein n=1 Tax=Shewanella woodyi TaxID=60961 RepID=UPI003748BC98
MPFAEQIACQHMVHLLAGRYTCFIYQGSKLTYKFISPGKKWDDPLPNSLIKELIPILNKNGYLSRQWEYDSLEHAQTWHPNLIPLLEKYGDFDRIPVSEFGSFLPSKYIDIECLFRWKGNVLWMNSPDEDRNIGEALKRLSDKCELDVESIDFEEIDGNYKLSFSCGDKNYKSVGVIEEYSLTISFLYVLYKVIKRNKRKSFVFFPDDENPFYTAIDIELINTLKAYGFFKKVNTCMIPVKLRFYFDRFRSNHLPF